MSLKIGAGAYARKMKVISAGISFMGNYISFTRYWILCPKE